MPPGGVENRSEQLALVAGLLHERGTDPRLGELLAARGGLRPAGRPRRAPPPSTSASCAGSTTGSCACRARWSRTSPAPPRWPRRRGPRRAARRTSRGSGPGSSGSSSSSGPRPSAWGTRTSRTTRCSRTTSPGSGARSSARLFDALRPRAGAARRARSPARGASRTRRCCAATSRATASAASARRSPRAVGFDFAAGAWISAVHPSCTAMGPGDCRITLRFDDRDFAGGLFTILHEVGHGLYEQGLDPEHYGTPMGEVGVGRHGRVAGPVLGEPGRAGPAVLGALLSPRARALPREPGRRAARGVPLRDQPGGAVAHPGPRRRGDLQPARHDPLRPGARPGLGRRSRWPTCPTRGAPPTGRRWAWPRAPTPRAACRTAIGPTGMIGYFPTYTLGDVFAAQLYAAAELELGSLGEQFARGEFARAGAVAGPAGLPAGRALSVGAADRGGHRLAAGSPAAGQRCCKAEVRGTVRYLRRTWPRSSSHPERSEGGMIRVMPPSLRSG